MKVQSSDSAVGMGLPGAFLVAAWLVALAVGGSARFVPALALASLILAGATVLLAGTGDRGVRAAVTVAGAVVVASQVRAEPGWVRPLTVVAVVVVAHALTSVDRHYVVPGVTPILVLGTIAGAFLTTPDTEVFVLLGATGVPFVLLALRRAGPYLGPAAAPASAVLIWAAAHEARGRPASFLAALACWGWIVLEPAVRWVGARFSHGRAGTIGSSAVAIAGHAVLVLAAARWAGQTRDVSTAALRLAAIAVVAIGLMLVVGTRRGTDA